MKSMFLLVSILAQPYSGWAFFLTTFKEVRVITYITVKLE